MVKCGQDGHTRDLILGIQQNYPGYGVLFW